MDKRMNKFTLELSAKAFMNNSEAEMRRVARQIHVDWYPLIEAAQEFCLMLWLADGSEILDYDGRLESEFEWACWMGAANPDLPLDSDSDTGERSLSRHPIHYRSDPPRRTYGWTKRLLEILHEEFGEKLKVGATFDPGPEFAVSDFKRVRHPECSTKLMLIPNNFIHVDTRLHADRRRYAAYPEGIAEGTHFGEFLGRQFACYRRDLNFDFLWLSNGIGFGFEVWQVQGALFDGQKFYPDQTENTFQGTLRFWEELRKALPDTEIRTRGSNLSAGIEMSTDGAPVPDIYDRFHPVVPVNSPWAALNYNTGVELSGWMSHLAESPTGDRPYRYYINDPWWCNRPWRDRYEREPWDIYMPLSVGTLEASGKMHGANTLSLMTADDSWGMMPEDIIHEVIPHLKRAFGMLPDALAPLVWLYPFRHYREEVFGVDRHPDAVFAEDWFIACAIQNGLPLNTVIGDREFLQNPFVVSGAIVVVPTSALADLKLADAVWELVRRGEKIFLYGNACFVDVRFRNLLAFEFATPLTGKMELDDPENLFHDRTVQGEFSNQFTLYPAFCSGGLNIVSATRPLLTATVGGECRTVAAAAGNLLWLHTLVTSQSERLRTPFIEPVSPAEEFPVERLPRILCSLFGWEFQNHSLLPTHEVMRYTLHRHKNAFMFSGLNPCTTNEIVLRTPWGVPIFPGMETRLRNGFGVWHFQRTLQAECRVFLRNQSDGVISLRERTINYPNAERAFAITGLEDAALTIFLPNGEQKFYRHLSGEFSFRF